MGSDAVELVKRPLGRQRRRPLDQVALELTAEVLLEAPQLIPRESVTARIVGRQLGLGLGSQPEGAADSLHVDAEDARPLAAPEGGDGQPREVTHRRVGPVAERGGDLLAQGLEVDLGLALPLAAGLPPSAIFWRAASASAARKKKRSKTTSKMRRSSGDLASVAASASRKSTCSVHGMCSSAWKPSSSSEVPTAMPSSRSSSANPSSCASIPPGAWSGMRA